MANGFQNNAIFWVEVDKIKPNPYQPRKDFDEAALQSLADSIKQYGVLQPLVVTRKEESTPDGGLKVYYELVAGERRLRASKLAGLTQVPVLIRDKEDSDQEKLELAIIENLQREDLNPIDKALAFKQLHDKFNMTHAQIAQKVGKSREYVSNALRLLALPEDIQRAIANGIISEGHARPLLMLSDKPEEQQTLFKEITMQKLTVREAEHIARSVATDKVRKNHIPPKLRKIERELTENLGTRVRIEQKDGQVGRIHIDFTSEDDLMHLVELVKSHKSHELAKRPKMLEDSEGNADNPELPNSEMAAASSASLAAALGSEIETGEQELSEETSNAETQNATQDLQAQTNSPETTSEIQEIKEQSAANQEDSYESGAQITPDFTSANPSETSFAEGTKDDETFVSNNLSDEQVSDSGISESEAAVSNATEASYNAANTEDDFTPSNPNVSVEPNGAGSAYPEAETLSSSEATASNGAFAYDLQQNNIETTKESNADAETEFQSFDSYQGMDLGQISTAQTELQKPNEAEAVSASQANEQAFVQNQTTPQSSAENDVYESPEDSLSAFEKKVNEILQESQKEQEAAANSSQTQYPSGAHSDITLSPELENLEKQMQKDIGAIMQDPSITPSAANEVQVQSENTAQDSGTLSGDSQIAKQIEQIMQSGTNDENTADLGVTFNEYKEEQDTMPGFEGDSLSEAQKMALAGMTQEKASFDADAEDLDSLVKKADIPGLEKDKGDDSDLYSVRNF